MTWTENMTRKVSRLQSDYEKTYGEVLTVQGYGEDAYLRRITRALRYLWDRASRYSGPSTTMYLDVYLVEPTEGEQ